MTPSKQPRVIIIGAGFGGLFAARSLADKPVDVLIIDRHNYHTFTPLLYQVATCALDPSEIAYPVRSIFRKNRNIRKLMGEVTGIDTTQRRVQLTTANGPQEEPYDYLIVATGSVPTFFGNDSVHKHAWVLRTLSDAVSLRNHILTCFEQAAWSDDQTQIDALTTIVVVGGGPTGLETAGAIYELYNHVLSRDYSRHELRARVILVEMQPYLLAPYPQPLRTAALAQLRSLGVEVLLENPVTEVTGTAVTLADGHTIPTQSLVWSTGVHGSPLAAELQVDLRPDGRLPIAPSTEVIGLEHIYAVGDIAYLENPKGRPYPMLIPVAQQQGELAAANILATIDGRPSQNFHYRDRGMMATIGRSRAVAWIFNRIQLRGYLAWLAWLGLHLLTLLGFRNRLNVFINWMWNYFTYDRSVRLILQQQNGRLPEPTYNNHSEGDSRVGDKHIPINRAD